MKKLLFFALAVFFSSNLSAQGLWEMLASRNLEYSGGILCGAYVEYNPELKQMHVSVDNRTGAQLKVEASYWVNGEYYYFNNVVSGIGKDIFNSLNFPQDNGYTINGQIHVWNDKVIDYNNYPLELNFSYTKGW